ncbi:MAG TPA: biotin--[acetyl-CoA-carboxylase] ligase [bacterium]|nr:biotin--[acetyl-CoA-carboxylase] ligase [bacterium]
MAVAYLGLGSNQGDRAGYLREALRRLEAPDLRVTGRSPIYESVPWGRTGQPTFLNQAVAVETPLAPRALLERAHAVEAALGRARVERLGPRTIDVDILLYGDAVVREPDLVVPHPELARRAFVLVPLAELAPGLRLPDGATVDALLAACPDRDTVWPWDESETGPIGREVRWFSTMTSTSEWAHSLSEGGVAEGTVVVAETQTAGRGRLGRRWASPAGGLWFSVIMRPRIPVDQFPLIGLAACVAVARAIMETTGLRTRLKWPNDILVEGRKVAGLLLETGPLGTAVRDDVDRVVLTAPATQAPAPPRPVWLVLGVGINANVALETLPPRLQYPATSLMAELGRPVERGRLLRAVLGPLGRDYAELQSAGGAGILRRWRAWSETLGRLVRVALAPTGAGPSPIVEGIAYDVDDTGALLVRTRDGTEVRVVAGDVTSQMTTGDAP